MPPESQESSIERLKRTLYSRNEDIVPKEKRTPVPERGYDVPTNWGDKPSFDVSAEAMKKRNNSFFNKFLIISVVFFVLSLGGAAFIFFGGLNMISSNNVDIKIVAPSSISSGEELQVGLSIVNSNRTDLEGVNLFVEYPDGTQALGSDNKILTREDVPLGTIGKGDSKDYSIRALLFGEKDSVKEFTFRIEYKVKGSNATFSKEKKYQVVIGSSPILLNVSFPQEVNSGQELSLAIEVTSNSSVILKNTMIKIEYPYGFTYKDSSIKPIRDNSIWNIGDLKGGDKKTITVRGVLVGQNLEDRSFLISAGTQSVDNTKDFDATLAASSVTIGIRKSFFDLTLVSSSNGIIPPGQVAPIDIKWQNTLPDKIVNSHIEAVLSGNALDRSSVSSNNGGFYRSLDNTILWTKNSTEGLDSLLPGDDGQVSFSVGSFTDPVQLRSIKNPHIDVHVTMTGDRSGTDSATISSTADITIKLMSTVSVTAKSYRTVGPFSNTGSLPPHADKESTYTIAWTLTNTTNDLKDTVVFATLPPGVSWKNETSPASERISFNPDTNVVTWNVGNVTYGTGFTNSARTAYFKVGLTPSVSQISSQANLLLQTNITSTDTYTNSPISITLQPVNTRHSDPGFKSGDEIILK